MVAWVGYVEVFVNKGATKWGSVAIALVGLWIPAMINISGVKNFAKFQLFTTILKFIPLVFMATVGLFFIRADNFGPFNASKLSLRGAISPRPPSPCSATLDSKLHRWPPVECATRAATCRGRLCGHRGLRGQPPRAGGVDRPVLGLGPSHLWDFVAGKAMAVVGYRLPQRLDIDLC